MFVIAMEGFMRKYTGFFFFQIFPLSSFSPSLPLFFFSLSSWTPPEWEEATPIQLKWIPKKESNPDYEWKDSLSLVKIEQWVR